MKTTETSHTPKITSRQNPLVQRTRAVRDGREPASIFIEGLRLAEEAIAAALAVEVVLLTERLMRDPRGADLRAALHNTTRIYEVSDGVMDVVTDTKSPQGVVLLARRPHTERAAFEAAQMGLPLIAILHGVNNPANAGAMLRVAEAAGASGVIATDGAADLFSPKALRGAMGSAFRLPLWTHVEFNAALAWCAARGIITVATDPRAARSHTEHDWTAPAAVIIGPEANGLTDAEASAAAARIHIPMRAPVESLNAATALAVVLYEAARQRADAGKRQKAEGGKQKAEGS
jgi:RNA methyltransferase, TrmH family